MYLPNIYWEIISKRMRHAGLTVIGEMRTMYARS